MARGIADHRSEIPDQEYGGVAFVLKMLELAEHNGMAEVQVGRGGIDAKLHAERLTGGAGTLEFGAQLIFADDFRYTFAESGELFIDGAKCFRGGHSLMLRSPNLRSFIRQPAASLGMSIFNTLPLNEPRIACRKMALYFWPGKTRRPWMRNAPASTRRTASV